MHYLIFFAAAFVSGGLNAQPYRLAYDTSAIPELYHQTTIFLQEKEGNAYKNVRRKYRLFSENNRLLRDNIFVYSNEDLKGADGIFPFIADVEGARIPLTLEMPVLTGLRFNFYTDSIKPVLNFYVNVEGVFSSGKIFPLTEKEVLIRSDVGTMKGMEWVAPPVCDFPKVKFTAVSMYDSSLRRDTVLYLKQTKDPRDAEGFEPDYRR